ncbi:putative Se/S carrier-like protein [uncultured Brachyspira sp.]|uniref:putative Se/S carrier-like protein n=1 Tax=uncultured Brachyspira sp. TaxID=221953 RepID=UPI0025F52A22|nr:putative Se/S carrier-like protein [uncultured Brachyspira sp.]
MSRTFCYLQTPRDLIKAEKILLDAGIEVIVRPAPEHIFGVCNMAIDIDDYKKEDIIFLLESAGLLVTIKDTE